MGAPAVTSGADRAIPRRAKRSRALQVALVALAAVALTSFLGAQDTSLATVYGHGSDSCGNWIGDRRNTPTSNYVLALRIVMRESWVLGFVSGASHYTALRGTSSSAIVSTVDRLCARSSETISRAARAAVTEFGVSTATPRSPDRAAYGPGTSSCGKWLKDASSSPGTDGVDSALFSKSWLFGFVSAAGIYSDKGLRSTDSDAMEAWVTQHCTGRVLDSLQDAAALLVRELTR
jgi:hypothetical protein